MKQCICYLCVILILSILSGRASVNNILEQMPLNRSEQLPAPYNVAKCNLGKVNLEAMLVSSFPSYSWGGPMPLAGAPRDLYTQLLACSSSQSVVAIACCLRASLCFGFSHPSLPLEVWAR